MRPASRILLGPILAGLVAVTAHTQDQTSATTFDLYKSRCQACHMADGNSSFEPINLSHGNWKHGSEAAQIGNVIADGVPGTAMLPFKAQLTQEQIEEQAAYLRAFDESQKPSAAAARPPIVGIAHIGIRTDDLAAARRFYTGILGFQEPFSLDDPPGTLLLTYFKVNDHQYIEVFPELTGPKQDRLSHISFETTDAEQLRAYLASRGVKVPAALDPMLDGNRGFDVEDPDGHTVEFVQFMPGSLHSRNFGKFLPAARVSQRMIHLGIVVQDRGAADRFYKDVLGFRDVWHGGMTDKETDWVDMRVPEGSDWLEYMLNVHDPSPQDLGVMHHLALGVPSVKAGYQTVAQRGPKPEKPEIGRDGKWQLNLYDPNFTRVELMEPKPVRKPCCSPILE